jgi:hypothetical protein
MSELSPAAQAVLDAYINAPCGKPRSVWVAAALRAAADQVVPADGSRKNNEIRAELLTIAAELDGTNTIN